MDYYSHTRSEMIKYIPSGIKTILDIGCGEGNFGSELVKRGFLVWGVEPHKESAKIAETKLTRVLNNKFDSKIDLPFDYFDCIIFNDVLEHLYDPGKGLLLAKQYLKNSDSRIIASIPNFRYWYNLIEIIFKKDFQYKSSGILDYTHIRFFTKNSIKKLFSDSGLEICLLEGINPTKSYSFKLCNFILFNLINDMKYLQYAVEVKKNEN